MSRTTVSQRVRVPASDQAAVKGARPGAFPGFIEPCHPTLAERAPTGAGWLHEIKADGYRVQVHIRRGRVSVYSREGLDWTDQYPTIVRACERLAASEAILDGEAQVAGERGIADLQALRRELGRKDSTRLAYHAFDLLYLDGRDLRDAPLSERKTLLRDLLAAAALPLVYVEHIAGDAETIYRHACKIGLEGI